MSKKIVITGAAGFIGSQLALRLLRDGHEVVLIDDLSFGYEENLQTEGKSVAELIRLDVRSPDLMSHVRHADCLFHLAGISALPINQSEPERSVSVNVAGTANVLDCARRGGVGRVVFASTSAVYENNTQFPCREDDPIAPTLMYSLGKWQAERLCLSFAKNYGMDVVITRYYNVYGPHQDIRRKSPALVGYIVRELLQGRAPVLHSDGSQSRDYVFLDDVNALNIACMESPAAPGQTFNVASGSAVSVSAIYDTIASHLDTSIRPHFRPAVRMWDQYPALFEGKYPMDIDRLSAEVNKFSLGATEKARELLGWQATTTLADGIRKTVDYARSTL